MKRKVIFSIILLIVLLIGGVLKYTDVLVINTGNKLTSTGVEKAKAWYSSYQYRKTLTLDEALITGTTTLTNFPVLISMTDSNLRSTSYGGHVYNANGFDIIFTDTSDQKLDHEIESYDQTTGTVVMWVRIPSLPYNVDTDIYMYYGNSGIGSSQENKTGVWGSNYKGVWHMDDGSSATIADSTSYGDTFTKRTTTGPANATGKIGSALQWNGSSDYASMADNANISPTVSSNTFSTWIYVNAFPAGSPYFMQMLGDDSSANTPSTIWRFGASNTSTNNTRIGINYNDGSNHDNANNNSLSAGTWKFITITTDGTSVRYYIDGVLDTTNSYPYTPRAISQTWYMGAYGTTARYVNGIMDEMRIYYGAALSADWIQAEFANQNNQGVGAGKFIQSASAETVPPTPTFTPSPTPSTPTIGSPTKLSQTNNSVTVQANISSQGGSTVSARGGCVSTTDTTPTIAEGATCQANGSGTGTFNATISSLIANTTYYYSLYATNGQGTQYTTWTGAQTFKTDDKPTVTTSAASSITTSQAILNSTVNPNGASTNVYYLWDTANPAGGDCSLIAQTALNGPTGLTGTNNLSGASTQATLPSLTAATTYYFCVMATNTYGTSYGSVLTFDTQTSNPNSYNLMSAGSSIGGPDCDDTIGGKPCIPASFSAAQISSSQINLSWSANGVPAPTSYTLSWCNRTSSPSCDPIANQTGSTSTASTSYPHTGLPTSTTYAYGLVANNGSGASGSTTTTGTTASCVNTTLYKDNDGDGYGNSGTITQGLTTFGGANSGTTAVINKPTDIVNGELMVAALEWDGGTSRTITAPAGWNLINTVTKTTDVGLSMWYKYASSEPSSYTWTMSGGSNDMAGWITSFGNVDPSSPIGNVTTNSGTSASHVGSSLTPTGGNYMLIMAAGNDDANYRYTAPAGMNTFANIEPVSLSDLIGGFSQWTTSSGSTGNKTATYGASWGFVTMMVELKLQSNYSQVQCIAGVPAGWSNNNNDCDDLTTSYYTMRTGYGDADGDGVRATSASMSVCSGASVRPGFTSAGSDCNDSNGAVWQNQTGYRDTDGDGYSVNTTSSVCSGSSFPAYNSSTNPYRSYLSSPVDCNDNSSGINPGATEVCEDGIDNDCSGGDASCGGGGGGICGGHCDAGVWLYDCYDAYNQCTISGCSWGPAC